MDDDLLVTGLAALGQATRVAMYRAVTEAGPRGIQTGVLAAAVSMPPNYLSKHLQVLVDAGLLSRHARGRTVTYVAVAESARTLADATADLLRAGDPDPT